MVDQTRKIRSPAFGPCLKGVARQECCHPSSLAHSSPHHTHHTIFLGVVACQPSYTYLILSIRDGPPVVCVCVPRIDASEPVG